MHAITRQTAFLMVGVSVILGGAGGASAHSSGGGSGFGGAVSDPESLLFANQMTVVGAMGPGVAAQDLNGTFTNLNSSPVYISTVTATIGSIEGAGVSAGTCEATDYTLANASSDVGIEIPSGASVGTWGLVDTPTIQFNNKADENQDDCKNVTVRLRFTIN